MHTATRHAGHLNMENLLFSAMLPLFPANFAANIPARSSEQGSIEDHSDGVLYVL
jgi:hypothetical protein